MIILHVTYTTKPGQREAFINAIAEAGIDAACRAENGNCCYDYFYAAQKEDTVLLVEKWESIEALKAHMQTAHFQALGPIKEQFVQESVMEKYNGESF